MATLLLGRVARHFGDFGRGYGRRRNCRIGTGAGNVRGGWQPNSTQCRVEVGENRNRKRIPSNWNHKLHLFQQFLCLGLCRRPDHHLCPDWEWLRGTHFQGKYLCLSAEYSSFQCIRKTWPKLPPNQSVLWEWKAEGWTRPASVWPSRAPPSGLTFPHHSAGPTSNCLKMPSLRCSTRAKNATKVHCALHFSL
jgi:hypothetical protein